MVKVGPVAFTGRVVQAFAGEVVQAHLLGESQAIRYYLLLDKNIYNILADPPGTRRLRNPELILRLSAQGVEVVQVHGQQFVM